jgi:hypothetical protein
MARHSSVCASKQEIVITIFCGLSTPKPEYIYSRKRRPYIYDLARSSSFVLEYFRLGQPNEQQQVSSKQREEHASSTLQFVRLDGCKQSKMPEDICTVPLINNVP